MTREEFIKKVQSIVEEAFESGKQIAIDYDFSPPEDDEDAYAQQEHSIKTDTSNLMRLVDAWTTEVIGNNEQLVPIEAGLLNVIRLKKRQARNALRVEQRQKAGLPEKP